MSETDKSQRRDDLSNHLTCFFGVRRTTGCVATPTSIKRDGRINIIEKLCTINSKNSRGSFNTVFGQQYQSCSWNRILLLDGHLHFDVIYAQILSDNFSTNTTCRADMCSPFIHRELLQLIRVQSIVIASMYSVTISILVHRHVVNGASIYLLLHYVMMHFPIYYHYNRYWSDIAKFLLNYVNKKEDKFHLNQ
ncbi:hypothetical protein HUJ05_012773 [Dendroctonus ponderosae]|nr:hypothetical protein HUJ05_012773 [Dendroctonus ponderosae]